MSKLFIKWKFNSKQYKHWSDIWSEDKIKKIFDIIIEMLAKPVLKSALNTNYGNSCSSVVLPQRHLALISLSLGFLVIWTTVIAAVLVSHTFRDNVSAKETLKIFQTHKQIGKIVFAIGHEMSIK